nr:ROK family transcriptional regulator [Pedobacter panaciterrae]
MSVIIKKNKQLKTEILKGLYYNRRLSILDLSKLTRKSVPLVASIVNELIDEGYVIEEGLAPSTGGRRPSIYLINPDKRLYIVAVAVDQLITRMVIYDFNNTIVLSLKSTAIKMSDDRDGIGKLVKFINENIKQSGLNINDIVGIGIGMPGFVNNEKNIYPSIITDNLNVNLKEYLVQQFDLPVHIDNDSSLIAFAELKFGKGMGKENILVLNVGWGTGLGMIINGVPYRGHSGYGGEFSHIPLSQSNDLCSCGKRGCIEVETSLAVMANKAQAALDGGAKSSMEWLFKDTSKQPGDHFLDAASQGDPVAVSILSEAAFQLGKGVVMLLHIMNPEKIIISGRGAIAGKMFLPPIQQAINEYCILRIAEQTTIEISDIARDAELMGAAALVVEQYSFE